MSPRKKSKPNPKATASGEPLEPEATTTPQPDTQSTATSENGEAVHKSPSGPTTTDSTPTLNSNTTTETTTKQSNKSNRKWYGGTGSWRSKASPIAQIANQSIGVVGGATSELAAEGKKKSMTDSPRKLLSKRKSSKGNAIPASMTKLNVTSSGSVDKQEQTEQKDEALSSGTPQPAPSDPPLPPEPPKSESAEKEDTEQNKMTASTFGWRSWWSRPDGYQQDASKSKDNLKDVEMSDAQTTPLPGVTPSEEATAKIKGLDVGAITPDDTLTKAAEEARKSEETKTSSETNATDLGTYGRSWFRLWSNSQNAQTDLAPTEPSPDDSKKPEDGPSAEPPPALEVNSKPAAVETVKNDDSKVDTKPAPPAKSSAWAFWSRDKSEGEGTVESSPTHKQVGELAVADTPSQSKPEAAQFNEEEPAAKGPAKPAPPKGKDAKKVASKAASPAKVTPSPSPTGSAPAAVSEPAQKQTTKVKQEPSNLILPEFRNTYRMIQKPSYWQQIRQYFLGDEKPMPHLHIAPQPIRIKKALAIGVHGFFPAPIIQKVLGQPTGTSIRFSNAAAAAIQEYTEAHGYSCEIEKVALEGEGFIADRVNSLWKLLLNWIEQVKQADFIFVACHSQGVPVAIMLVAKLIQFGCVNAARIGICAMAGVNLGPFPEYKTRYLGATAAELFEFSNPKSMVSQMYLTALEEVLRYGVRIVYVGSIDDQLVSLESSTFSTLSHPYIYRAVFVDGRIHAPDFITHLVGFALKLRNLGLPDHGLIRELSPALAGSLYTGEGHSRIYEDPKVYDLAVSHALETTTLPDGKVGEKRPGTAVGGNVAAAFDYMQNRDNPTSPSKNKLPEDPFALKIKDYESPTTANQNPYYLPWAMRGLLEEEFVKRELGTEVEELLGLFESWKPVGKGLKDVRFRLEAVRSKL